MGQWSFRRISETFPGANLTPTNGTEDESIKLCSKEDLGPFKIGTPAMPGKQNDLLAIQTLIRSKAKKEDIADMCCSSEQEKKEKKKRKSYSMQIDSMWMRI